MSAVTQDNVQYVILNDWKSDPDVLTAQAIDAQCLTEEEVDKLLQPASIIVDANQSKWSQSSENRELVTKNDVHIKSVHADITDSKGAKLPVADQQEVCISEYQKNPKYWSTEATKRLISIYKEHHHLITDKRYKKKIIWQKITDKLREDYPYFNAYQVESKWNNLLKSHRNYLANKEGDKDEGRRKSLQIFDEMESFVEKFYLSNSKRKANNENDIEVKIIKDDSDCFNSDEDYIPKRKKRLINRRTRSNSLTDVLFRLHKMREASKTKRERERELNRERRHQEKMELLKQILQKMD